MERTTLSTPENGKPRMFQPLFSLEGLKLNDFLFVNTCLSQEGR